MAISWAEGRTNTVLSTKEDGTTWLEEELTFTVQDCIESQSFSIPADRSFSNGLALTLTGRRHEAEAAFQHAREIARAAFTGLEDDGSFGPTLHLSDMSLHLFATDWLLEGERSTAHLEKAVYYLQETERRLQNSPGLELGTEGYADLVLVLVLLQNGTEALPLLPRISRKAYELPGLLKGRATRTKTLSLAVRCLCDPALKEDPKVRERLHKGVEAVMREEFSDSSPDSPAILLWLDLPGVNGHLKSRSFGQQNPAVGLETAASSARVGRREAAFLSFDHSAVRLTGLPSPPSCGSCRLAG